MLCRTLTIPFKIFRKYEEVVSQNYHGTIPLIEKFIFYLLPFLIGLVVACNMEKFDASLVTNLVTIHGIFLSVLVASHGQFLEVVDKPQEEKVRRDDLDTAKQLSHSKGIVKKLLFVANCFSVVLCIFVIGFSCFLPSIYALDISLLTKAFVTSLFGLVTLNCFVVFRTIHILSDLYFSRT